MKSKVYDYRQVEGARTGLTEGTARANAAKRPGYLIYMQRPRKYSTTWPGTAGG